MEDADLEEVRAKRLAELQAQHRVNLYFYMVSHTKFLQKLIT
jgi:DNA-binding TFAR19-related protein (PDSD5 family)